MILEVEVKFNKGLKNMFSLIISIISIALVAALAAATVYFGGAAFNKGGAGADASAFVNAGQQIAGAFTLATTDSFAFGAAEPTVDELKTGGYLSQVPNYKSQALVLGTDGFLTATVNADVCNEINKRAYGTATAPEAKGSLYGCLTKDTTAYYKVR